ncbi:HD domain-containing phosphohydrolase [Gemmatimonas groenlandica]|uniref:PAS domain S-box protein n=1 Tax=Gemmatimonas groenlandica TaxID=2732249 RepID=A0A6M4IPI6_9BACT|nr:HD domain-containing phosphohydrolase [Gemmatimonas groenlandica]QJR35955.1 PAS domain S-box protein [Gemmatimonas groenlandica]
MSSHDDVLRDPNRLAALTHSGLLAERVPDQALDRLTRLASSLLGTPMILLSLLTDEHQVITSAQGLTGTLAAQRGVPLSHSLCRYVVGSGKELVLDDAQAHAVVCDHPGVRAHQVRAYAGAPITLSDGRTLGSFCAVDTEPRVWSNAEIAALRDLASIASAEIEARVNAGEATVARRDAGLAEERFRATFEQAAVGIAHVGLDGRWLHVNRRLCETLGYAYHELQTRTARDFDHDADESEEATQISGLLTGVVMWYQREKCYRHRDGHAVWGLLTVSLVRDDAGEPAYFIEVIEDISARRQAAAALEASEAGLRASQAEVLARLARAGEVRDDETGLHTRRVGELSALIAHELGWAPAEVELIRQAAPLHDVGKIGVPDAILLKEGPLTAKEREQMQAHAALGAALLSGGNAPVVRLAEQIAHAHHERWDGTGYPRQLAGTEIPLGARIVAVADAYDALANARPYRPAWPVDRALAFLREGAGSHFDPTVVAAFMRVQANDLARRPASTELNPSEDFIFPLVASRDAAQMDVAGDSTEFVAFAAIAMHSRAS